MFEIDRNSLDLNMSSSNISLLAVKSPPKFMSQTEQSIPRPDVFIIISFIVFLYLISTFLDHNFFHHGYRMRVATTSLIYRKVMRLCSSALTATNMELIITLVSKDMDVFPIVVLPATYLFIGPVQLIVTCYLLWSWLDLGPVCLSSLILLFLLFPVQVFMGRLSRTVREQCDNFTKNRLKRLHFILTGLEEMKASNFSLFCQKIIARARRLELIQMKKLSRLQVFNSALTLTSGKVVVLATFVILVAMGKEVDATQIFTTLALVESLRVSLSILLPAGLLALSDTLGVLEQVERVLLLPEKAFLLSRTVSDQLSDNVVVKMDNYFASKEKNLDAPMVLVNIDIDILKNEFYTVIGPPESGKSCLLLAILGELERKKGLVLHSGRLGYIPAQPWLCSGTIRDNITFGTEFSTTRYTQVVQACALNQILESLPLRDDTMVGERGIALDPTTMAKITLARAVYQNCDIYLLDDILRGMDAKSSMEIFKKCICGLLRTKTRLLVTDNIQYAQASNQIILMSQCRVHHFGSYDKLLENGINVERILKSCSYKNIEMNQISESSSPLIQDLATTTSQNITNSSNLLSIASKDNQFGSALDIIQTDFKDSGDPLISLDSDSSQSGSQPQKSTYANYFLLGGGILGVSFFMLICLLEQGGLIMCEWWLSYWSENYQNITDQTLTPNDVFGETVTSLDYQIFVYVGLVCATAVLGVIQAAVFYSLAQHAGAVLHNLAFGSLLDAPLAFFDANSRGGVFSHFVRDAGIVDSLPPVLLDSIQSFSMLLATAILVGCINYWLFAVILPILFLFLYARNKFHSATQDVERIELSSKGAVGAHVVSTMEGIQTIRSLNVEQRFLHKFDVYQDRSTAACYLHLAANRWFGIRVDLMGTALVVAVTVGAFLVVEYQEVYIPASLIGLSLYYALNLINVSQPAMRKSAAVDFKMRSVSHLLQYHQLIPECSIIGEPESPTPSGWPRYGIITCEGVTMQAVGSGTTKPGNVLKNIWCCIRAQEKLGMLFSSAAEQRAFISMLFRLSDFNGVVRVDGVDILAIPKSKIRNKIAYIPQNPSLFIGTIRECLDPESFSTDTQVWRVLEQVHLAPLVRSLPSKLSTDLINISDYLTIGQRQLLRLASAMLHHSKIIVYEEPTSSLDIMCNTIIQGVIRTQFLASTVIHVAHLPDTIIHTDRIMIISSGKISEVDTPHYLLEKENSQLTRLVAELGSAQMTHLKQLALDKHENRPYVQPHIDPSDFQDVSPPKSDLKSPINLNLLPTFHSSRLAGVLNQLPTNKFSTDRL